MGWVVVSAWDYEFVDGMLGEQGSRPATTLLMGTMALLSGLLVLHHRRSAGDEEHWTGTELVHALALFLPLLYGVYSFFGWYF